jgi:hypothetical protein
MAKKQNSKKIKQQKPKTKMVRKKASNFGPVTTISTAPVAIGNSIRGSKPIVVNSVNGCRVVGRDFCFEAKATVAAATSWSLIGGMPITPAVLATSSLRSYAQLFSNFRINRIAFHYITSSPTSQAGDIMFYYERERNSPMIDFTSNSFLPFVLSDPSTVIGPQWENHSVLMDPVKEWKNTNYGLQSDLNEESCGSMFLFSKTNAANSPGYILVDFDITFREMCINPRAGIIPITRGLWNYLTFAVSASAVTTTTAFAPAIGGNNPDGTATALPSGCIAGDIYKVIFLITNSTVTGTNAAWTNVTAANLLQYHSNGTNATVTVDDGFTLYAVYSGSVFNFYPSIEASKAATGVSSSTNILYGVSATVTYGLCTLVSYIGSVNNNLQSSY